MLNILYGIILIMGGASGRMVLIGTDSSGALVLAGVGLIGYGIFQVAKRQSDKDNSNGIE